MLAVLASGPAHVVCGHATRLLRVGPGIARQAPFLPPTHAGTDAADASPDPTNPVADSVPYSGAYSTAHAVTHPAATNAADADTGSGGGGRHEDDKLAQAPDVADTVTLSHANTSALARADAADARAFVCADTSTLTGTDASTLTFTDAADIRAIACADTTDAGAHAAHPATKGIPTLDANS